MSAVGNALAAIDPGPALKSVGKSVESVVREVGKGAESLGREIGKVGEAALKNPVGTIANIAAIATQQYWALPLISATSVVANGGSIEQALKAGAISAAAAWAAQGISESLNDYFATELTSSAGNASLTATNTLADGTIQHVFSDGSTILQGLNGALSTTPATIAPSLASQLPVSVLQSINTALANAGGSAAMTALQGGNLNQILLDAASGGVGSFAGTQTTTQLRDLGLNTRVAQVLGRTAGAAAAGAVEGQDMGQIFNTALVNNIVRTSLSEAGNALKNTEVAKGLTKYLNEAIQPFKDKVEDVKQSFLEQAKKLTQFKADAESRAEALLGESESVKTQAETFANDVLSPAEQRAQNAYKTASSSFDQYKSVADQFSDLVSKYDAAKAANNIDLANQYADQANALIPRLNQVTDRYNADFSAYEVAKNDFETKNNTYLGYVNKLNQLNEQYTAAFKKVDDQTNIVKQAADQFNSSVDEMQSTLNAKSQEVENAYQQAAEYSPIAKSTFADLFGETGDLTKAVNLSQQVNALPEKNQQMYEFAKGFGMRAEDALQFAPDVSKMSVVAMQSFFDSLAENPDPSAALQTANTINSLGKVEQDAFFNARIQGLDANQALNVANTVGGASREQQQVYIDSVKSGLGGPLAEIFAAAKLFTGPGTRLESPIDKNLAALTTPEGKRAYQLYLNALGPENINQAFALAKGEDDAVLARGTGTQSAGTGGAYLPPSTERSFFDARRYNPATQEWEPIPIEGQETGGMGGGTGTGTLTSTPSATDESGLRLTQRDIDQYRAEGVPEIELQKMVDKYGIYTPGVDLPDEYQFLVDRLFKTPETKKIATTGAGTTTTPGGTGTGTTTAPGGTSTGAPTSGAGTGTGTIGGTGTTGGTGAGTTPGTGATTSGPSTTGGAGGTTTAPGGAGGTDQSGAGTGGTGGGGTGTGGGGTGGFGIGGIGGGGFAIPGGFGLFGLASRDPTGGIKNLTAGLTERMDYNLAGLPSDQDTINPLYNAPQIIPQQMATGGSTSTYDPFSTRDTTGGSGISSSLTPNLTKAQINYILTGLPDYLQGRAEGGHIEGHNPQFYSEGGLSAIENRFVKGEGDGTSDSIPAMLADGEFVIPADVVSSLGNGSNDAGASVLDEFLKVIREHKRKADAKNLPEDSKGPLAYLIDAQRRAKA